jgi:hypothetical protein
MLIHWLGFDLVPHQNFEFRNLALLARELISDEAVMLWSGIPCSAWLLSPSGCGFLQYAEQKQNIKCYAKKRLLMLVRKYFTQLL